MKLIVTYRPNNTITFHDVNEWHWSDNEIKVDHVTVTLPDNIIGPVRVDLDDYGR